MPPGRRSWNSSKAGAVMILIKRDELKDLLREVVREELKGALVRTITVEKGPDGPGDPEKRIESKEMNILDFMAQYLPQVEGRLLGVQADMNKTKNTLERQIQGFNFIGKALLTIEQVAKDFATSSERLKKLADISDGVPLKLEAGDVSDS